MEKPVFNDFPMLSPLTIQKYERYLPTAFDESMSLLEKSNKIIEFLNHVERLLGNFKTDWETFANYMIDYVLNVETNLNKTQSDFVEFWENFVDEVYGGVLKWEEPVDTFEQLSVRYPNAENGTTVMTRRNGKVYRFNGNSWLLIQDINPTAYNELEGKLTRLVNEARTEVISNDRIKDLSVTQIDKNKGKIDQTFLSDDLIQQMAGTTPVNAVPANGSITEEKLAFSALRGSRSKNLLNQQSVVDNQYIDGDIGTLFELEDYVVSDWIPVVGNLSYSVQPTSFQTRVSYYTDDKTYISSSTSVATSVAPETASFARVALYKENLPTAQFEQSISPSSFVPFGVYLDETTIKQGSVSGNRLKKATVTDREISFPVMSGQKSKNLFDKSKAVFDKYIDGNNGDMIDIVDYFVSDFIDIEGGKDYTIQPLDLQPRIAFYDENKKHISQVSSTATVNAPPDAYYARISQHEQNIDKTMFEQSSSTTPFEMYGVFLKDDFVLDGTIEGTKIKPFSITQTELSFPAIEGVRSRNVFNKNDIVENVYLNSNTGLEFEIEGYFVSDYIAVIPNETYSLTANDAYKRIAFYTNTKAYISFVEPIESFIVPENALFMRFASSVDDLNIAQIEIGNSRTPYEEFGVLFDKSKLGVAPKRFYTLNDAWTKWNNGEKFPIAFWGDSTVDGVGTTGNVENLTAGTDHNPPNAFSMKLQTRIREITGKTEPRIYNAGHSGQTAIWGLNNIEAEFSLDSAYNDVKMVGVGWGINDRLQYQTIEQYRNGFRNNIVSIINWLYDHNIQPFLITTQATAEPNVGTEFSAYPLRSAQHINTVANEVKRDLAEEYGLELIDVNEYTDKFMKFSSYSLTQIISDKLHFGDVGHKYEADLMFSKIVPNTIILTGTDKLDYSSQKVLKAIPSDKQTYVSNDVDGFKTVANYTKENSSDLKIAEFWVFVDAKNKLNLKAYKSDATSLTYVLLNGVRTNVDSLVKNIGDLDLGLHKIEVFTGLSAKVDFKGFKVT